MWRATGSQSKAVAFILPRRASGGRCVAGLPVSLALLLLLSPPLSAATLLQVFSDPPRLRADGSSTALITAQVQDAFGVPAADGTPVSFSTTLGSVTPAAESRGGVARAVLTSGTAAGTAVITALAGDARQEIEVEFTPDSGAPKGSAEALRLEGRQIVYNREADTASVSEEARFSYGKMSITAEAMQCQLAGAVLYAQGNVEVSNGKETRRGGALVFKARRGQGSLLRYEGEEAAVYTFYAPGLEESREANSEVDRFQPPRGKTGRTLILAKRLTLCPDGQALLDDAVVLADGAKVIALPHYVTGGRNAGQDFLDQAVRLNSGFGLTADFPYYYVARPGRVGSLRITHNLTAEGALLRRGWALNLEEQYLLGRGGRGTLSIDDLAGETRGLRWSHSQEFSPRFRAYSSVRYTRFDADSPRIMEANTTFSRILPWAALDLSLRASSYADSDQYLALVSVTTHSRPTGILGFTYSLGTKVSYLYGTTLAVAYSPEDGQASIVKAGNAGTLGESLSLRLNSPSWKLGSETSADAGLVLESSWRPGTSAQSLSAMASLRRNMGNNSNLGVTYSGLISQTRGGEVASSHNFSLNLNLNRPGKWEAYGFASYQVSWGRLFGSGLMRYYLPFQRTAEGEPQWALTVSGLLYRWSSKSASDTKLSLTRGIGNWEVSLNYSPHGSEFGSGFLAGSSGLMGMSGYGYTQDLGRTFWMQIAPRTF